MKISEVIQKTGLSKRSIHYYVEEGLVNPAIDLHNGYKIFTEQEVEQLKIIKKLRELDFSLSSIKSVLRHPNTMTYYLYLQLKKEEQEEQLHRKRKETLSLCISKMPLSVGGEELSDYLMKIKAVTIEDESETTIKEDDAQLIMMFMWGKFIMGTPMTEYQQYLWHKLVAKMELPENQYLIPVKKYFYALPIEHVETQFAKRNMLLDRIADFHHSECEDYVEEMKMKILEYLQDPELVRKWKNIYHCFIKATVICADSTANALLSEMCPRFADYCTNINYCCAKLLQYLNSEDGKELCQKIQQIFEDYIDIESSHGGELAALASFKETV